MSTNTPPPAHQGASQHQAGDFNTLPDNFLFLLFVVGTILGGFLIYFNVTNGSAYLGLGTTMFGVIVSVLKVRPNFFKNALKLSISSAKFLMILRVLSVVLLLVLVALDISIYQAISPQHPSSPHTTPPSGSTSTPNATSTSDTTPTSDTRSWDEFTHDRIPELDDPLRDNTRGGWYTASPECKFIDGAYRMQSTGPNYCLADKYGFSNFAYEIQMTIVEGNRGGIVFRATDPNQLYYFTIDRYGLYTLFLDKNNGQAYKALMSDTSGTIKQGLNVTNSIGVVVTGSTIRLYINR